MAFVRRFGLVTKHFRFWIFDQNVPLALLLGVAVFHLGVWTFGPMALLGNLHQDTLEIVYWSRDLALGYPKHPPLAPFLVHVFLQSGRFGIFSLMVLSQIGFVITALYCAGVRQIVPQTRLKICVFCAVLLSPMSGIFGVQLNHNSLLMPAWAGCLYYGFAYLEQGRWRDGLGLALAAAIGAWLKYEIAFVLIGLLGVSLLWAPYRHVWRRPASYVGVVLFALLLAPHLWWLFYVDSSPLTYALEMQASDKVSALGRLNNFVVGLGVCLIGVGVVLGVMRCLGLRIILQWRLSAASLACALSLLALVVMSLITHQGIRQGWVIPFTPSVILAVVSWVRIDAPDEDWRDGVIICGLCDLACAGAKADCLLFV
jgi:4-amino-4-deoxy-L-arabinose transferase-like glycosyltransferase